jgi:dTDP-4-dehydrorhamnose reductase
MKILVLGGGGQVAGAVTAAAPPNHTVVVKTRSELDITDEDAVAASFEAGRFDWIVNGAAYTAVDLAEKQPQQAHAVNAPGCRRLPR